MECTDLASAIAASAKVKKLTIHREPLKSVPAELAQMKSLEELTFREVGKPDWSGLTDLAALPRLRSLTIRSTKLADVPPEIAKLTKLTTLGLEFNDLDELPAGIAKLTGLEEISLDHNCFAKIPVVLGKLTKLKRVDLGWNPIAVFDVAKLPTKIQKLVLGNTLIPTVPKEIARLAVVEELWLSMNRNLKTIAPEVAKLKKLQRLVLSQCGKLAGADELKKLLPNLVSL